jgi:hypothetical protein
MQQALRPYATAGIALVGAAMIAVTPVAPPPIGAQVRPVKLVDAWSDLFTETAANWQNILSHADASAISQVFTAFLTNPLGVIEAATNLTPTVSEQLTPFPTITVELTPGLELPIAQMSSELSMLEAIHAVIGQLTSDPANAFNTLFEAPAVVANAYLNGQQNVSLLDGIINIPALNGILAPMQTMSVDVNLAKLVDALGLGNLNLGSLDLTSLLNQIGLGNLTVGSLFSDLELSGKGLGDLLGNPSLGTVLSDLGLGNLGLGSFSLTSILSDLGLDTNVDLNSLTLDQILTAFGINPNVDIGLVGLLDNLGFSNLLNTGLGTELNDLGLLQGVLTDLNNTIGGALNNPAVVSLLTSLGLNPNSLLTLTELQNALNSEGVVGDLLGGQTLNESLANILTALGVSNVTPSGLTIGNLLEALGFSSATGDLSLSQLLNDLGVNGLNVGSLLNTVDLGQLLNDLGISNVQLDLSHLVDLSNLTLGGLLSALNLGDLASISVEPFGGMITELVDVVPQQILTALGL